MRRAVWRQRDFRLFWGGQTVSEIGSQVTVLAMPTLAIFTFHAGPGGVLATGIGATTTLWLTALLGTIASMSIVFTPLWGVRDFSNVGLEPPLKTPPATW